MAVYIHCNFNSEVLRMATDVNILIPDNDRVRQFREKTNVPVKYQTLYLLHGFSCDYTYYLRKTNIERYADEHQIMVVMPSMYNSAYTDMKYGLEYYTYLSEELLDFVERTFPASAEKENRFVAGMSMGGYGLQIRIIMSGKIRSGGRHCRLLPCRTSISGKSQYRIDFM